MNGLQIHRRRSRSRRATALILVVAVLALLAVMGTVYIIAARAERTNSAALSASANLNLARAAVIEMANRSIGESMTDGNGQIGGYNTAGSYGNLAARNYDYPETGLTFGVSTSTPQMRDQPWLCKRLHVRGLPNAFQSYNLAYPPCAPSDDFPTGQGDYTRLTEFFFDPATGLYDKNVNTMNRLPNGSPPFTPVTNDFLVVGDTTAELGNGTPQGGAFTSGTQSSWETDTLSSTPIDWQSDDPAAPNLNLNTPSKKPVQIGPVSIGVFGNLANGIYTDAYVQLLPFSDASGIRYRFGVRIIDTNRMANLNTASAEDPSTSSVDPTGTYFNSLRLAGFKYNNPQGDPAYYTNSYFDYDHDAVANLHTSAMGRAGSSGIGQFDVAGWQQQILHFEKPSNSAAAPAFFDLSDELGLRIYGEFGSPYHIRPALLSSASVLMWPYTLGVDKALPAPTPNKIYAVPAVPSTPSTTVTGNPRRKNYTTYSWSRELRPYADPATIYSLSPADGQGSASFPGFGTPAVPTKIWPTSPARAAANPSIPSADNDALFYIAMAATNIATAMEDSGYTQPESRAFVANYVTFRTDVLQVDPGVTAPPAGGAYFLPIGPSFVDTQGICIRSVGSAGGTIYREFGSGGTDINGNAKTYLGFSAQPFFNEAVAMAHQETGVDANNQPTLVTVVKDSAIELYNPFNLPLSLTGYAVVLNGGTPIILDGSYIPAKGFFVLYSGADAGLSTFIDAAAQQKTDPTFTYSGTGDNSIVLLRKYKDRSHNDAWAPVDYFVCKDNASQPLIPPTANLDVNDKRYSIERMSGGISVPWGAAFNIVGGQTTDNSTLGKVNNANGNPSIQLWDRSCENTLTTAAAARAVFVNIGELNHLMRITHSFTDTTTFSTLSDQLAAAYNSPAAAFAAMKNLTGNGHFPNEYLEAQLHFDFYADARVFATCPPTAAAGAAVDINAIKLLDHIAMVDRVSDPTIDIGGGPLDINKIRLPGLININTASGDVLRALPGLQNAPSKGSGTTADLLVANIVAYRRRADNIIPTTNSAVGNAAWYNDASNKTNPMTAPPLLRKNVNTTNFAVTANYPGKGFRSMGELLVPIYDALYTSTSLGSPLTPPTSFDQRDQVWANVYNLCSVRSDTFVVYGFIEAARQSQDYTAAFNNRDDWYEHGGSPGSPHSNSDPLYIVAQRRFIAIVDRSFCNYARDQKDSNGNPQFILPRIVAIQDLPY